MHFPDMRLRALLLFCLLMLPVAADGPPRSDAAVELEIRARLARSKLASRQIQVRMQGGIATLTGEVDIVQHKAIATRMAKSAGAQKVENRIRITPEARRAAAEKMRSIRRSASRRPTERRRSPARSEAPAQRTEPRAAVPQEEETLAPPPVRRARIRR